MIRPTVKLKGLNIAIFVHDAKVGYYHPGYKYPQSVTPEHSLSHWSCLKGVGGGGERETVRKNQSYGKLNNYTDSTNVNTH